VEKRDNLRRVDLPLIGNLFGFETEWRFGGAEKYRCGPSLSLTIGTSSWIVPHALTVLSASGLRRASFTLTFGARWCFDPARKRGISGGWANET
jgi:hypothetical protein